MKKTNLYYQAFYQRANFLKALFLNLFYAISSNPRLVLEVFIRKSFGERYFSFSTCLWNALALGAYPIIRASYGYSDTGVWTTIGKNASWYIFIVAFLYCAWQRRNEVKREPGVFDFAKFSHFNGIINPVFKNFEINGNKLTNRTISTLVEPGLFLAIGIVLLLCAQTIGVLIIICSICYSLSYFAAYKIGDDFIMDTIDKMIANENMVKSFVHEQEPAETKGFETFGRRPTDKDFRQQVVDNFFEDEEETTRAF